MAEIRRAPPRTLTDFKQTVEAFAESLDREEVSGQPGTSGSAPRPARLWAEPVLRGDCAKF